jgi:hypothetical protein
MRTSSEMLNRATRYKFDVSAVLAASITIAPMIEAAGTSEVFGDF